MKEVEYLGHIISAARVAVDPKKIEAMRSWLVPTDLKGLRGFLGITGYYRWFVKEYGSIAEPLTQLLRKDCFIWGEEAQLAFDMLKEALTTLPVLAVPNFDKPFTIETDASERGLGAVLMQEGRPIAYLSQKLSGRSQSKSVYKRELMAIVMAVQKWRHYLLGRKFLELIDQKSLKFLVDQRIMGEGQQKLIAKLLGFDFEIRYKTGRENSAADALSKRFSFAAISTVTFHGWEGLEEEIQQDLKLKMILQDLLQGKDEWNGFELRKGRLYFKGRIVIPKNSPRIGGHSGFFRTYKRIEGLVWWEGMRKKHSKICAGL